MRAPTVQLLQGDCREVLRTLPECSVDAIVTDPPYHLTNQGGGPTGAGATGPHARSRAGAARTGFMGQAWDGGDVAFDPATWAAAMRVLKPGGHLLAFSGSRTYHRMACAVEDAGFEIRDQIMWIYGSGFPKSKNLDGDWEGWGTALKPAHEPIVVARKPLVGTVAANVLQHGTGALNIDGCRVEPTGESRERVGEATQDRRYTESGGTNFAATPGVRGGDPAGRWPANIIHDGSDEVLAAFPDAKGQQGDLRGHSKDRVSKGIFGDMKAARDALARVEAETSAGRFFYCAKASRADRNDGLPSSHEPAVAAHATMGDRERADWQSRNGNHHPTVKPTELMRYLCRLVTPPGGTVLDPFTGSGSTGRGAVLEGFDFIGIERDLDERGKPLGFIDISRARIDAAVREVAEAEAAAATPTPVNLDLFAELEA